MYKSKSLLTQNHWQMSEACDKTLSRPVIMSCSPCVRIYFWHRHSVSVVTDKNLDWMVCMPGVCQWLSICCEIYQRMITKLNGFHYCLIFLILFSFSLYVMFFSLCLARWFWPDLMSRRHVHSTAVCVSLWWSGGLHVDWLLAGSRQGLPYW